MLSDVEHMKGNVMYWIGNDKWGHSLFSTHMLRLFYKRVSKKTCKNFFELDKTRRVWGLYLRRNKRREINHFRRPQDGMESIHAFCAVFLFTHKAKEISDIWIHRKKS